MSAVVKNQGTNGSQFNCIGYYVSSDNVWDANDAYLGASCQSLLFPGQSGPCAISGTISPLTAPGAYFLLLVADPLNAEIELNETNNVVSFGLTVTAGSGALPDLELWRPTIAFASVAPGGSTGSFTFIANRGTAAVGGYELGYYLSADTVFSASTDVFLGLVMGSSLSPSGMTIHSAPVLPVPRTTTPGNYHLLLVCDPRNVVAELNENNNSRALPLVVTGALATTSGLGLAVGQVYPSPVDRGTQATILVGENYTKSATLTLLDATGRQVAQQVVYPHQGAVQFETQNLPTGIYTLRLAGPNLNLARRVMVK